MTVKELTEKLKSFPDDIELLVGCDDDYDLSDLSEYVGVG